MIVCIEKWRALWLTLYNRRVSHYFVDPDSSFLPSLHISIHNAHSLLHIWSLNLYSAYDVSNAQFPFHEAKVALPAWRARVNTFPISKLFVLVIQDREVLKLVCTHFCVYQKAVSDQNCSHSPQLARAHMCSLMSNKESKWGTANIYKKPQNK